jgi:hypothetical protein
MHRRSASGKEKHDVIRVTELCSRRRRSRTSRRNTHDKPKALEAIPHHRRRRLSPNRGYSRYAHLAVGVFCASPGVRDQRSGLGNVASELPTVRDPSSVQPRLPMLAIELSPRHQLGEQHVSFKSISGY